MNKKILIGMLLIVAVVVLTGCEEKKEEPKKTETKTEEKTNTEENNTNTNVPQEQVNEIDYELYTDDKKMVFKDGTRYSIYYYSGNKITGYHAYIDYGTNEAAEEALANYKKPKAVSKAYTKDRFLVLEYAKSEYSSLTVYKLRSTYGDLEQLPDK